MCGTMLVELDAQRTIRWVEIHERVEEVSNENIKKQDGTFALKKKEGSRSKEEELERHHSWEQQ